MSINSGKRVGKWMVCVPDLSSHSQSEKYEEVDNENWPVYGDVEDLREGTEQGDGCCFGG